MTRGMTALGAASAVCGAAPLGLLGCDSWKVASPTHMGIMQSRYEGSFSAIPSRNAFASIVELTR